MKYIKTFEEMIYAYSHILFDKYGKSYKLYVGPTIGGYKSFYVNNDKGESLVELRLSKSRTEPEWFEIISGEVHQILQRKRLYINIIKYAAEEVAKSSKVKGIKSPADARSIEAEEFWQNIFKNYKKYKVKISAKNPEAMPPDFPNKDYYVYG